LAKHSAASFKRGAFKNVAGWLSYQRSALTGGFHAHRHVGGFQAFLGDTIAEASASYTAGSSAYGASTKRACCAAKQTASNCTAGFSQRGDIRTCGLIYPLTHCQVLTGARHASFYAGARLKRCGHFRRCWRGRYAKWTSSGGVIDAKALDAIRKNSVNAAIQQLRPGMDATAQRNLAASVMNDIKPTLIDAIEQAGGTGYRQYLADYTKGMQQIAEKKLAGKALEMWKSNKDEFVRLVQNESPEVVEKILGPGKYNIATELADSTMAVLQEQAKKRLTDIAVKEQITAGQDALKQLLLDNMSKLRVPSYLNAVAATTNKALQILETKIGAKTMTTLTEALKTPQGAADLLATLPGEERIKVLKLLSDPSQWKSGTKAVATGTTTMGVNALAPDRYDNALANQPARIILNNMAPGRP